MISNPTRIALMPHHTAAARSVPAVHLSLRSPSLFDAHLAVTWSFSSQTRQSDDGLSEFPRGRIAEKVQRKEGRKGKPRGEGESH